jgi:pimeloyl-ACP methyl ester carboxylesterase
MYSRDSLKRGVKATFSVTPGAPALYLHGEQDGCMQAEIGAGYAGRLMPGSRFERVSGVGHFLQLEDPGRVSRLVDDWIGAPA